VADDKCIAAYLDNNTWKKLPNSTTRTTFGLCRIFHYSDNSNSDWSHWCGYVQGFGPFESGIGCADSANAIFDTWFLRVPDGQTLDNCPGVAAIP
jgi:hypothetical protein